MPRRKTKGIPALAEALAGIAAQSVAVDSTADRVLAIVKGSEIRDVKAFSKAVREAYKANGWNSSPGKPKRGEAKGTVPATVKQYVSLVRGAFKAGLEPWRTGTFHALRKALKEARAKAKPKPAANDPMLQGIRVTGSTLTGAPFHDLLVAYDAVNRQQKAQLRAEVAAVVKKYTPAAVSAVPELVLRKAA